MELSKLLERMKPYDDSTKQQFFNIWGNHPELAISLEEQLRKNTSLLEKAKSEVFFIVNYNRWKRPKNIEIFPTVRFSKVGPEGAATISIDF